MLNPPGLSIEPSLLIEEASDIFVDRYLQTKRLNFQEWMGNTLRLDTKVSLVLLLFLFFQCIRHNFFKNLLLKAVATYTPVQLIYGF